MKSFRWFYRQRGYTTAIDFRFEKAVNEAEARAYIRSYFGMKRLPPHSEVWIAVEDIERG